MKASDLTAEREALQEYAQQQGHSHNPDGSCVSGCSMRGTGTCQAPKKAVMKAHDYAVMLLNGPNLDVVVVVGMGDYGTELYTADAPEVMTKKQAVDRCYDGWDSSWGEMVILLV
jgi:hypothetical protein